MQKLRSTSDVTYRYPELQDLYVVRLRSVLSSRPFKSSFQRQLHRYFLGEIPHSKDILKSLLQALMGVPTAADLGFELSGDCNTIPRVSHPWPGRTKNALRVSLDEGTFEDFHFTLTPGPVPTKYPMYFAGAVDKKVASSIGFCKLSNCHSGNLILENVLPVCLLQQDNQLAAEISLARSVTHLHSLPHSSRRQVGRPLCIMYTPI